MKSPTMKTTIRMVLSASLPTIAACASGPLAHGMGGHYGYRYGIYSPWPYYNVPAALEAAVAAAFAKFPVAGTVEANRCKC